MRIAESRNTLTTTIIIISMLLITKKKMNRELKSMLLGKRIQPLGMKEIIARLIDRGTSRSRMEDITRNILIEEIMNYEIANSFY